jgi:hypothetical protein
MAKERELKGPMPLRNLQREKVATLSLCSFFREGIDIQILCSHFKEKCEHESHTHAAKSKNFCYLRRTSK